MCFTKDIEIYDLKSLTIEILGSIDYLLNWEGIKYDSDIEKKFSSRFWLYNRYKFKKCISLNIIIW